MMIHLKNGELDSDLFGYIMLLDVFNSHFKWLCKLYFIRAFEHTRPFDLQKMISYSTVYFGVSAHML